MRLTLRTLLAYLDDILEPAQVKELGAKIAESSVATNLIERIRDVMRRRRLGAPDLSGPEMGIDANTAAEYLDNTLTPKDVAEVEKIALESDVHLAEIAACHQILILAPVERVEIPLETRQRMYALGGGAPETDEAQEPAPAEVAAVAVAAPTTSTQPDVPEYLRESNWGRRVLLWGACAALFLTWIALVVLDPREPERDIARVEPNDVVQEQGADGDSAPEPAVGEVNEPVVAGEEGAAEDPAAVETPVVTAENIEEGAAIPVEPLVTEEVAEPETSDEPMPEPEIAVEEFVPEQPVAAADPQPAPIEEPAAVPAPPIPMADVAPALSGPPAHYTSPTGILLRYAAGQGDWYVMPHRSVIDGGETLAVPPPFTARLDLGGQTLRTFAQPDTLFTPVSPTTEGVSAFALARGRLVFEAAPEFDPAASQAADVEIRSGSQLWLVEILDPGTIFGAEIDPAEPTGFEKQPPPDAFDGSVHVRAGAIRIMDGVPPIEVRADQGVSLSPGAGRQPESMPVPEWVTIGSEPRSPAERRYWTQFEGKFPLDTMLSLNLPSAAYDRHPLISEYATRTLGLMGQYDALVDTLVRGEHEEARQAAIDGLRRWLAVTPGAGATLRNELAKTFRGAELELVYQLLWGYSTEEAKGPDLSTRLVAYLDNDSLTIRELAIHQLVLLTGRTYGYHANLSDSERRAAARKWEQHLAKNDGALINPGDGLAPAN